MRNTKGQNVYPMAESLKRIYDLAFCHPDVSPGYEPGGSHQLREKSALFDLKILWEGLGRMGKNANLREVHERDAQIIGGF